MKLPYKICFIRFEELLYKTANAINKLFYLYSKVDWPTVAFYSIFLFLIFIEDDTWLKV